MQTEPKISPPTTHHTASAGMEQHHYVRTILDYLAIGGAVGTLAGILPDIAAGLSCIWLGIQIGEYVAKKIKE